MVEPNKIEVLGCNYCSLSPEGIVQKILEWASNPFEKTYIVVVTGFHGLWVARKDQNFKQILNSSDILCPDGVAPVLFSRLLGRQSLKRLPGERLMESVVQLSLHSGCKSYFYGDTDTVLEALKSEFNNQGLGHCLAGAYSPPFRELTDQEDAEILERINSSGADILWVGLGTPKQDRWIAERRELLKVKVAIGIGAAFGMLSGQINRAPKIMGDLGFAWLWRLFCEPQKLWRRNLVEGPQFLIWGLRQVLRERLRTAKK